MDRRRLGFDAVFVDVGGLSGSDGLLEVLYYSRRFPTHWNQGTLSLRVFVCNGLHQR